MAEEIKPTVDAPEQTPEQPTETAPETADVDGLMAELERVGVRDTEGLQNKLTAASQSGHLAQLLGDERKRSAGLEAQVAQLQQQASQSQPSPYEDPYATETPGQTIDLGSEIEKGVERVLTRREQAQAVQHQANLAQWNKIQSHRSYGLVKDVWEEKLRDPNFNFQIQSGQINAHDAFMDTVTDYYEGIAKRSLDTIKTLRGTGEVAVPHVETGERVPTNIVGDTGVQETETMKRRKELKEKVDKGHQLTHEEEIDIIDSLLDTPIVPPGHPAVPRK